jgi:SAM-dependent methyltransferase
MPAKAGIPLHSRQHFRHQTESRSVSPMGHSVDGFIAHWKDAKGGERAQSQTFLNDLCDLIGVARPKDGDYKFEFALKGDKATDFVDLYKRGCFVLESKQSRAKGQKKDVAAQLDLLTNTATKPGKEKSGRAWDVLMLNARQQAENYARHLPSSHEWPPFIVVCDVGHCFEIYADFTGKGRHYEQFPDRQGFRVVMEDFRKPEIVQQFKLMWDDPHSLNPARKAAKATREIAKALAEVSKRLEASKHHPEEVALFLMRCLFTMFAEDTELIPKDSFTDLLQRCTDNPKSFMPNLMELWKQMNAGGFSVAIGADVMQFNGRLFQDARVFPMEKEDIGVLKAAAGKDWKEVDPSIFGTLLEQALDTKERASLGAHYTPRAYVERLVQATVIEPLRGEWQNVQGSLAMEPEDALERVRSFHQRLCEIRVLDPACGTGNFLYVTLELMKKLEGEVLDMLLQLGGQEALRLETFTVDPHQFLGIEKNPRAAAIADSVLWIGFLRWHLRTRGYTLEEPILREFKNIERRDAVLEHDGVDIKGNYVRPRRPEWPAAEFIVGNPPFIGGKDVRAQLGDHYAEALWKAHPQMNDSADFVMYWWDKAAELLARKGASLRRFGLVTTNSIKQPFQRRTIERHLSAKTPISILMAVDDLHWPKVTADSADLRIVMTVAERGKQEGKLLTVQSENGSNTDEPQIELIETLGQINADLTVGVDVTKAVALKATEGLCSPGVKLHGSGFIVTPAESEHLGLGKRKGLEEHIRNYRNGRDLMGTSRKVLAIDLFDLDINEVRERFPEVYQHILQAVKPERDRNNRESYKKLWWVFGEPRKDLRPAFLGQPRYIATVETAKHRVFQFLDASILPDNMLVCIASKDAVHLGILSSRFHVVWTLSQGGTLEDRPRYTKGHCFDPFPFPNPSNEQRDLIARIAEGLDNHRKDVQAAHPEITLTQMYNVLEKVKDASRPPAAAPQPEGGESEPPQREGIEDVRATLSADEQRIFDDALILILKERHDELDAAVAAAYGWPADLSDDDILARLVALNKERAAEEAKGFVRWLRPDYQIPRFGSDAEKAAQIEADLGTPDQPVPAAAKADKASFPTSTVEQVAAVMAALAQQPDAVSAADLARGFKQGKKAEARIAATLSSLARTGFISVADGGKKFALQRAA